MGDIKMSVSKYENQIYSGVLGKIIGVYLGRPIEGWTYEAIKESFNDVNHFVHKQVGVPLIVPDDDISGTFVFFRSLEDNEFNKDLTASQIGETWLNYIIENQTVLWWGGLSRSTEHTAYLRLKNGIKAPMSGSSELNGKSMSEQIGAQIFIDSWALASPNNPELAVDFARKAASVSHDGIAVDAACLLAHMEASAFEERDIDRLLTNALSVVNNDELTKVISDLREECNKTSNWREVREWLSQNHGYDKYPGSCPMVTNHLVVIMAILMGGDDFQKSIMIAASAGWDTDCNAGNVGCLNGIRLGLEGISQGPDYRKAVSDRMYVVSSDGGSCITDAVMETRKIVKAACALNGEELPTKKKRFSFEYPGSTQGFTLYDDTLEELATTKLYNYNTISNENGLVIDFDHLAKGNHSSVSVDTFIELESRGKEGTSYFEVLASPSLYSTQEIEVEVLSMNEKHPTLTFFIDIYDQEDEVQTIYSDSYSLVKGSNKLPWSIPNTKGHAIYRLGVRLTSNKRLDGSIVIKTIDWNEAPKSFELKKSLDLTPSLTPWTTNTTWIKSFMSSADHFNPDFAETFSISHSSDNGVVTTGSKEWNNYSVSSELIFTNQESAGLLARANGHKRYYSVLFHKDKLVIRKQKDSESIELAQKDFQLKLDTRYNVSFTVNGHDLEVMVDGVKELHAIDYEFGSGGAGFVVNSGAILAKGFKVSSR